MRGIGSQHITPDALRAGHAPARLPAVRRCEVGSTLADRGFAARAGLAFEPVT
jgi:hypothetical protein